MNHDAFESWLYGRWGLLEKALAGLLDRQVARRFGSPPPGLIGLQRDMIRESLRYFALAQHAEYLAGWRIVPGAAEYELAVPWDEFHRRIFPVAPAEEWRAGITLKAKIDRIDVRTREDGVVEARVLDYKTAAEGKSPRETHFCTGEGEKDAYRIVRGVGGGSGEADAGPAEAEADSEGGLCWQDLQLPLYVLLARHYLAGGELLPDVTEIGAGYFNLPSALAEIGVRVFAELASPETLESAAECADRILRRIFVEERFWPPTGSDFECFPSARIAFADFIAPEPKGGARS